MREGDLLEMEQATAMVHLILHWYNYVSITHLVVPHLHCMWVRMLFYCCCLPLILSEHLVCTYMHTYHTYAYTWYLLLGNYATRYVCMLITKSMHLPRCAAGQLMYVNLRYIQYLLEKVSVLRSFACPYVYL